MIDWIVGRMHVSTSDADVEADIRARANKAGATKEQADDYVRQALKCHHANQREYAYVMGGMHGYTGRKKRKEVKTNG
jgi:hypothetical protein